MDTADKVIVTNVAALEKKYGRGADSLTKAVKKLIAADAKRHLTTVVVDLSDRRQMARYQVPGITPDDVNDPKANKRALDAVYQALVPSYLMILGAPDIVPQQRLDNPLYHPQDDDDKTVPTDLPYACEAPYGTKISAFRGPTRVVGRLPDINGGSDPKYLIGLLQTAAKHAPRPIKDYDAAFGLSALVWRSSTNSSLNALFGDPNLHLAPAEGPPWKAVALKPLSHFINCHGSPHDYRFYGQSGGDYPVAHDSTKLRGLRTGTVLAAECCYGAQLFNPAPYNRGKLGMCNAYLAAGAIAYLGSSTIAYGPASGNAQADLICQYFFRSILAGASAGRACLEARLGYVRHAVNLSPTDLKTLAQFDLMGDPSMTPVVAATPLVASGKGARARFAAVSSAERVERESRRHGLRELAASTSSTPYFAALLDGRVATGKKAKAIQQIAKSEGLSSARLVSFAAAHTGAERAGPQKVHVLLSRDAQKSTQVPVVRIRGLELLEFNGAFRMRAFQSR